jgi:ribosomal protein S3
MVIGKGGTRSSALRAAEAREEARQGRCVNIVEVRRARTNAQLVAEDIARSWRRASPSAAR